MIRGLRTSLSILAAMLVPAAGFGQALDAPGDLQQVVISEVAWAGTRASSAHEWIELRSLATEPIDLAEWTLRWRPSHIGAEEAEPWFELPLSGRLAASEPDGPIEFREDEDQPGTWWVFWDLDWRDDFLLIVRGTDSSILHTPADLVYDAVTPIDATSGLDDSGAEMELIDPRGRLIDRVSTGAGGWAAGESEWSGSMERTDPHEPDSERAWHTNLGLVRVEMDAWGNLIHGTPKHENSPVFAEAVAAEDIGPTSAPMGEPILVRFDPLPEWPADERMWRVVVTRPPLDEVLEAEWSLIEADDGAILVEVAVNRLPLNEEIHIWARTPSGDVLFAPFLFYPY